MPRTDPSAVPPPRAPGSRWRRAVPLVLAMALVGYVLARIDWPSFWRHLREVSYPALVGFMVLFILALLAADALAARYVYRRSVAPVSYRDVLVIRGASYLPSSLNHHLGQAWLTYVLSRAYRVPLGRVAGGTLVAYATWGGCVLGLGCVALLASDLDAGWVALPLGAGVLYLALLAVKPRALARNRVLGPLFEVGVSGHFMAMALRLPHMAVLFAGTWLPFWFFGVDVPFGAALRVVPIIMVAVTLPITPQGFGTRDVLAATFFESYVLDAGPTHGERLAAVAAATTTQGIVIALIGLAVGALLMPHATRRLRAAEAQAAAREETAGG
jgi:hypothetical protein